MNVFQRQRLGHLTHRELHRQVRRQEQRLRWLAAHPDTRLKEQLDGSWAVIDRSLEQWPAECVATGSSPEEALDRAIEIIGER